MPKQKDEPKEAEGNNKVMMLVAYVFTWLTGLIVYLTAGKEDEEVRFHALQAIFLGIGMFALQILGFVTLIGWIITIPLNIILWIYGIYVGYKAYSTGERIMIPYVGEYALKYLNKE